MVKVGLTGGIGSGKSIVSKILSAMGYGVYDSDSNAARIMISSVEVKDSILNLIGSNAYLSDGTLNKEVISAFLYGGEENRKSVNSIVHPAVFRDFDSWCLKQDSEIVFVESAILFESGLDMFVDRTVMVSASLETRVNRVLMRDKICLEQIEKRMRSQMADEEKLRKCDFVINNDINDRLLPQIFLLLGSIECK